MTDPQQLSLFASFESSSRSAELTSQPSSEHTTSFSAGPTGTRTDATTTSSTPPATGKSSRGGAGAAASSRSVATLTAGTAQLRITQTSTEQSMEEQMLALPRPTSREQCREEARPCPWVGCRHHLLLEVAKAKPRQGRDARPTTIRLNMPSRGKARTGRRRGLASSAASALVRVWIDDAVEALSRMPFTCSLDVREAYPDGLSAGSVGWILGVTEQEIEREVKQPHVVGSLDVLRRIARGDDDA